MIGKGYRYLITEAPGIYREVIVPFWGMVPANGSVVNAAPTGETPASHPLKCPACFKGTELPADAFKTSNWVVLSCGCRFSKNYLEKKFGHKIGL